MKLVDYAPGLTVVFSARHEWMGETTSPEPYHRHAGSTRYYAQVRWRNGISSVCLLRDLEVVSGD